MQLEDTPEWPSYACLVCLENLQFVRQFKDAIMTTHTAIFKQVEENRKLIKELKVARVEEVEEEPPPVVEQEEIVMEEELIYESPTPLTPIPRQPAKPLQKASAKKDTPTLLRNKLHCSVCNMIFPTYDAFEAHMQDHAAESTSVICCNQPRFGYAGLMDHLEFHVNSDRYTCNKCLRRLDSSSNLRKHQAKNHPAPRFQCNKCGKICLSQVKLHLHLETHTPGEQKAMRQSPKSVTPVATTKEMPNGMRERFLAIKEYTK